MNWFARGIALEEDPNTQIEAISAYHRVLDLDPSHAAAHINLGTLYYNRQDFNLAEKHYRAALEADFTWLRAGRPTGFGCTRCICGG